MRVITSVPKPNGGTTYFLFPDDAVVNFSGARPGWFSISTPNSISWFNTRHVLGILPEDAFSAKRSEHTP